MDTNVNALQLLREADIEPGLFPCAGTCEGRPSCELITYP